MKINIDMMCLISSIMDKLGIDAEIKDLIEKGKSATGKNKEEKDAIQQQLGMEVVFLIGKKLHLVKEELIQFICLYKGIEEKEAKELDIIEFIKQIMKDKGLLDFLKQKAMSQ